MNMQLPPATIDELMSRARAIAGLTIGDLAGAMSIPVPDNLVRHKGFVGQLLEQTLGSDAGNQAQPDFVQLGVELKTLPLDEYQRPMESTYVTVVPLTNRHRQAWKSSVLYKKLRQVLWIPIEAGRQIALPDRRIGMGILWQPDAELLEQLRQDYEELMTHVIMGEVEQISADQGKWLQIRPKAANRKALTDAVGADGERVKTLPRGFYLRPSLTRQIIAGR